jgi:SAM-dependent methyltransferase
MGAAKNTMTSEIPGDARAQLPRPFNETSLEHLRHGIFDDPSVDVFVDAERSFACLSPRPEVGYDDYKPRKKLPGLGQYKKDGKFVQRRLDFISDLFGHQGSVLEIGSSDGAFLKVLRAARPKLQLYSIEPDAGTQPKRQEVGLSGEFSRAEEAAAAGVKADIVCFFHVFEHIPEPTSFLATAGSFLTSGGRLIIEVPSLDDPLLSIYGSKPYEDFYFQRQHPYVYTSRSLQQVLAANGWRTVLARPYQRYGLENHLGWLTRGKPGGDAGLADIFAGLDADYKSALEKAGKTDTIFVVAERA